MSSGHARNMVLKKSVFLRVCRLFINHLSVKWKVNHVDVIVVLLLWFESCKVGNIRYDSSNVALINKGH